MLYLCGAGTILGIFHLRGTAQNFEGMKSCTHHSPQVMLFHQPEGVLVARGEVAALCGPHMTSGHRTNSMDHICKKRSGAV